MRMKSKATTLGKQGAIERLAQVLDLSAAGPQQAIEPLPCRRADGAAEPQCVQPGG